jgi:hypothetical protein
MNKSDLLKTAAEKMLQLNRANKEHTKRAHALRLLYKQAELGVVEIPSSYSELEEKLASLMNQNLEVIEKALEYSGGTMKLGEIDDNVDHTQIPKNADQQFQAAITEG